MSYSATRASEPPEAMCRPRGQTVTVLAAEVCAVRVWMVCFASVSDLSSQGDSVEVVRGGVRDGGIHHAWVINDLDVPVSGREEEFAPRVGEGQLVRLYGLLMRRLNRQRAAGDCQERVILS